MGSSIPLPREHRLVSPPKPGHIPAPCPTLQGGNVPVPLVQPIPVASGTIHGAPWVDCLSQPMQRAHSIPIKQGHSWTPPGVAVLGDRAGRSSWDPLVPRGILSRVCWAVVLLLGPSKCLGRGRKPLAGVFVPVGSEEVAVSLISSSHLSSAWQGVSKHSLLLLGVPAPGDGSCPPLPPPKADVHQLGLLSSTQCLGSLPGQVGGATVLWVLLESSRGCDCTWGWASASVWALKGCFLKKS